MSEVIKKAVKFAVDIANDDSHGYDQLKRWGEKDYDCSALVIDSWDHAGCDLRVKGATYTGNMKDVFLRNGFEDVTSKINLITGKGLETGDVLLKILSHTAMYIGDGNIVHASINEKSTTKGGKEGDQTGKEICIRTYYNKKWHIVLRYKQPVKLKPIVSVAKEVISGKWGNGAERRNKLAAAGYDYATVQAVVNSLTR